MRISRGDIFSADLNPAAGSEQGGVRPVLILQNNEGNRHSTTTVVAAISSNCSRAALPTHVKLPPRAGGLMRPSVVMTEQVRVLDKNRLQQYIGSLDESAMARVDTALRVSLGLT